MPSYTAQQMIDALEATRGMKTLTAKRLGCAYQTVQRYINKYPTVKQAYLDAHNMMGDAVELKLYEKAMSGDTTAMIFMLKTKFRERGYSEKYQIEVSFKTQAVDAIKNGDIDYQTFLDEFEDEDLAQELFRQAGVPIEVDHD